LFDSVESFYQNLVFFRSQPIFKQIYTGDELKLDSNHSIYYIFVV
jgi:hypothetical protein